MRYIKVLLLVILFFFVMLFFVQNQAAFSQATALKLDLLVLPVMQSMPIPTYSLLLVFFLVGALCTLFMLLWDRIAISARLTVSHMRSRGFEKDLERSKKLVENKDTKLSDVTSKFEEAKAKADAAEKAAKVQAEAIEKASKENEKILKDAEARALAAEARAEKAEQALAEASAQA